MITDKDNDLRCRVNKRATKLFGPGDSEAKRIWAAEEFEKRRQKRMEKERRKNMIDNVMSVPGRPSATKQSKRQQPPQQTPEQTAAANAAATAAASAVTSEPMPFYQPAPVVDPTAAAKMFEFPPDLQRQLLEQLNNMIVSERKKDRL